MKAQKSRAVYNAVRSHITRMLFMLLAVDLCNSLLRLQDASNGLSEPSLSVQQNHDMLSGASYTARTATPQSTATLPTTPRLRISTSEESQTHLILQQPQALTPVHSDHFMYSNQCNDPSTQLQHQLAMSCDAFSTQHTVHIRMEASKLPLIAGVLYDIEQATGISSVIESRSVCKLQVAGTPNAVQNASDLLLRLLHNRD